MEIAVVLGLLVLAVVLFALETFSVDVVTLLLLIGLIVSGVLTPREAFGGFAEEIIIMLAAIFVLSGALQKTGVLDFIGARLHRLARGSIDRLLFALMSTVAAVSAFMNNTTTTAIFIPPTVGVARQSKVSPSKLLMPVAYASILGGTLTLIGTSTNIAVSGYIARAGMAPLGLFEATPVGLAVVVVGIAYMMLIGKRLLPDHREADLAEEFHIREYLSEIVVVPGSHLAGQEVFSSDLARLGFRVLEVIRGKRRLAPTPSTRLQDGDVLFVQGKVEDLMKVRKTAGIEIEPDLRHGGLEQRGDLKIAEVLVAPQSELIDRTIGGASFRQRYGLVVLAIYRQGEYLREKLGKIRLRLGDLLLVQGPADALAFARQTLGLWVLEERSPETIRPRQGILTVAFFAAAVVAGGAGWLPLPVAFLGAALAAVISRCVTAEEAYDSIDWRLIVLIGGMTAFGTAMEKSGAAQFLARGIAGALEPYGAMAVLAGFAVLTVLLTQPMSNAAAALVVLPVALHTAAAMDLNQRTFAIAIMLAASVSFITPLEPSCVLVYNPGKYRFFDFVKTGALLTLILLAVVLTILPVLWPLQPAAGHSVP